MYNSARFVFKYVILLSLFYVAPLWHNYSFLILPSWNFSEVILNMVFHNENYFCNTDMYKNMLNQIL